MDCWFKERKKGLNLVDWDLPWEVAGVAIFLMLFLLLRFRLVRFGCFSFGVSCPVSCSPYPGSLRLFGALLFLLLDRRTAK